MKPKLKKYLIKGLLVTVPFCMSSGCSTFGLYSEGQVEDITEQFHEHGYDEGRAHEIRLSEHHQQSAAAGKQVREEFYTVYVPQSMNERGVMIEGHYVPIKILVEE